MYYTKPKLIQLIHIAKSQFGMDELTYRTMLENLTGKRSTKAMKIAELMNVLVSFEMKGFNKNTSKRYYSPATAKAKVKSHIAHKIRAIWIEMAKQGLVRDRSETALNAWVRGVANPILVRQNKPLALNVSALDDKMASLVLERLKKWQARGEK
ncbi:MULTISPECIES: gp16 family protein [unclassified Pasteurella]|uniref:gp16 family protein n=1 Tax=unclassified Pasteurella TaxID=2621516 RepID=UPI001073AB3C|nr:regulatory protein GemA [Pasteurella sp. 19428wF3_WM03]TFU50453.1 regulatory protein GemA [Pasteurella sp. WM03]